MQCRTNAGEMLSIVQILSAFSHIEQGAPPSPNRLGSAASRLSHTKRGQPIGLAPFPQQPIVDYFLEEDFLEVGFFAGAFFLLLGGASSALAEAV